MRQSAYAYWKALASKVLYPPAGFAISRNEVEGQSAGPLVVSARMEDCYG